MKIILFSDPHYGPTAKGVNSQGVKRKLNELATVMADKMIAEINRRKPSAAILLGDLIEDVLDHDADVENLSFIWNHFKKIEVPFYSVVGNHDLRTLTREEATKILGYNNLTFSVNLEGYHLVFLGLTSLIEMSSAEGGIVKTRRMSDADLQWLENDLKNNRLPALVFLHYGLAEDDMKGNWWFSENKESALLQNRKEVKTILERNQEVFAVFSGHQHWTKHIRENGIDYYLLGSLVEDTAGTGTPEGIWLEVDLDGKKLKITHHHLLAGRN